MTLAAYHEMTDPFSKPPRPPGRLKQLNKAMRRVRRHGKRSEFIVHCEHEEARRLTST